MKPFPPISSQYSFLIIGSTFTYIITAKSFSRLNKPFGPFPGAVDGPESQRRHPAELHLER